MSATLKAKTSDYFRQKELSTHSFFPQGIGQHSLLQFSVREDDMSDNTTNEDLPWHLVHELSWADCVRLMSTFEAWANDERNNPQRRHDWLRQSRKMRLMVSELPYMWEPARKPGRPSILKFIANRLREHDEWEEGV